MGFFDFLKSSKPCQQATCSSSQQNENETVVLDLSSDRDAELIAKAMLEAKINDIGRDEFPDNEHNSWQITDSAAKSGITFVRAVPTPDDVGYPEFVFACVAESSGDLTCLANYCMEGEEFTLLATGPNAPADLPRGLRW